MAATAQMEEELCSICCEVPLTAWTKKVLHGEAKHAICQKCFFALRKNPYKAPSCPFCRKHLCEIFIGDWECSQCSYTDVFRYCGNMGLDECNFHCSHPNFRGYIPHRCYTCRALLCGKCFYDGKDPLTSECGKCSNQSLGLALLFKQE